MQAYKQLLRRSSLMQSAQRPKLWLNGITDAILVYVLASLWYQGNIFMNSSPTFWRQPSPVKLNLKRASQAFYFLFTILQTLPPQCCTESIHILTQKVACEEIKRTEPKGQLPGVSMFWGHTHTAQQNANVLVNTRASSRFEGGLSKVALGGFPSCTRGVWWVYLAVAPGNSAASALDRLELPFKISHSGSNAMMLQGVMEIFIWWLQTSWQWVRQVSVQQQCALPATTQRCHALILGLRQCKFNFTVIYTQKLGIYRTQENKNRHTKFYAKKINMLCSEWMNFIYNEICTSQKLQFIITLPIYFKPNSSTRMFRNFLLKCNVWQNLQQISDSLLYKKIK